MTSHAATESVEQVVRIDLHVNAESPLVATVNSMDELKVDIGPLHMFMDAVSVKCVYKVLRDRYHEMTSLSNLPDPLPMLDD